MASEEKKLGMTFENTVLGIHNPRKVSSVLDLKTLGLHHVCYMKHYMVNGQNTWVLHAADGTAVAVQKEQEAAMLSARHQELEVVALH